MIIKRSLTRHIQEHLTNPEITMIIGPRQAGKTTLMELIRDDLKLKGEKTLFLNLDLESDRPFFATQDKLLQRITYEIGKERGFIFIDEIQRKENAGLFLKGLYDMKLPYKFVVSGSGSVELKEKIHESLPGRKRLFELPTLSFGEFVNFKRGETSFSDDNHFNELATFFDLYKEKSLEYLEEYLKFGGYPKVVLAPTIDEKQAAIADIYQSFLEKDISILLNIQKTDSLTSLARILASQIGNLVNVAELSNTLGISVQTVKNYLWYLEKTYIIRKVRPYFTNVRKEITKAPTYYFEDLGLRNYASNQFGNATSMPGGFLFENFVYNNLKNSLNLTTTTIHFWRTKDKAEVDLILNTGSTVIPIEVKYSSLKTREISRSFRSFLNRYKPSKAYIVHLGLNMEEIFEKSKIYFIPFFNTQVITNRQDM